MLSMRVDGHWFNDERLLPLFIADFEFRNELASLTRMDVDAAFKRVANFFGANIDRNLADDLEITSPEYGLARQIGDRRGPLAHHQGCKVKIEANQSITNFSNLTHNSPFLYFGLSQK